MLKNPLVSIIIPTYNRKQMAERLIRSILKNSYKKVEIIIIDDASPDHTYEYLKQKFGKNKKIKILKNNKNLFTAESRNKGIRNSSGDLLFFIDDDNTLDNKIIEVLVEAFNSDAKLGEAGPVNYNFNDKRKVLWFITKRNMFTTKTDQPRDMSKMLSKKIWESVDIPNAFMARSDIVKKNKIFFKKRLGIMYEESDFAYRIRNLGFAVKVVRSAKIFHDIEKSKDRDWMYHFMNDKRRPFVIARNRIIFHSIYSTQLQFVFIAFFWIWFFTIYYFYKILFYSGFGKFSILQRFDLCMMYLKGNLAGLSFVTSEKEC